MGWIIWIDWWILFYFWSSNSFWHEKTFKNNSTIQININKTENPEKETGSKNMPQLEITEVALIY